MKKIPKRLRTQDRVCKKFQLLGVSRRRTEGSFKNTFLPKLLDHMLLRVGYKLLFPNLLCAQSCLMWFRLSWTAYVAGDELGLLGLQACAITCFYVVLRTKCMGFHAWQASTPPSKFQPQPKCLFFLGLYILPISSSATSCLTCTEALKTYLHSVTKKFSMVRTTVWPLNM